MSSSHEPCPGPTAAAPDAPPGTLSGSPTIRGAVCGPPTSSAGLRIVSFTARNVCCGGMRRVGGPDFELEHRECSRASTQAHVSQLEVSLKLSCLHSSASVLNCESLSHRFHFECWSLVAPSFSSFSACPWPLPFSAVPWSLPFSACPWSLLVSSPLLFQCLSLVSSFPAISACFPH